MDTRRFRHPAPSDAVAAFRWLGWVMLMMFVLVQNAHAETSRTTTKPRATRPQARELSQASVQFDPGTHLVTVSLHAQLVDGLAGRVRYDTDTPMRTASSEVKI